tara:strand:+ start:1032 stop:1430 length:399 start_codon:yes stop_codon:yes gene_type:complete
VLQNLLLNIIRKLLCGIEKEEDALIVGGHFGTTPSELVLPTISNKLFIKESFLKSLIVIGCNWIIHMVRLYRFGNIPHIYGNFTHESKIVNAVDSFLDSLSSILIGFGLAGEHTALEAELVVIVSGGEEHCV